MLTFEEFRRVLDLIGLEYLKSEGTEFRNDIERVKAFYSSMELENRGYKSRLNAPQKPFLSKDKPNFRIPENDLSFQYKMKPHTGLSHEDKKSMILRRLHEKEMSRASSVSGMQLLGNQSAQNSILNERESKHFVLDRSSYFNIEKQKHLSEEKSKITWKKLENLTYTDLKGIGDEKFRPQDLIVEDDEEDAMYMGEYNIQEEKAKREMASNVEKKKVEEYGKLGISRNYVMSGNRKSQGVLVKTGRGEMEQIGKPGA